MSSYFGSCFGSWRGGDPIDRTRECLLGMLAVIDVEGWDGPTGRRLLAYVHDELVRPLARGHDLHGAAGAQACATGVETAWQTLAAPKIRQARSPWGLVWSAVRRAILAEIVTTRYATTTRDAWRQRARDDDDPVTGVRLVSLTAIQAVGWDPPEPATTTTGSAPGPLLGLVIDALTAAGWDRDLVTDAVVHIAGRQRHPLELRHRIGAVVGVTARQFGLPLWRARRLIQLVEGTPDWPGIVERLALHGPACLHDPSLRAAIESTVTFAIRPPLTTATSAA